MSDLSKFRAQQLQDPEFREYYMEQKVHSDIAKAIVAARLQQDLSQLELARRSGVAQSDISRLENCDSSPSLKTLKKIAKGLGLALKVEFVPIETIMSDTER